jgi:hypothetical protein
MNHGPLSRISDSRTSHGLKNSSSAGLVKHAG